MRFEVLIVVTVKSTVFLDVTPYSMVEFYRQFRRKYCLCFQGQRVNQISKLLAVYLLDLLSDPQAGGSSFF
jgi:hypothetical protein